MPPANSLRKTTHLRIHNDVTVMKKVVNFVFYIDTAYVEMKFEDSSTILIYYMADEDEVAENMYQHLKLDFLI